MSVALYFIAILPDEKIFRELNAFKAYVATHFQASHALKSPPHVTLFPPFKRAEAGEGTLLAVVKQFAETEQAFSLRLHGFGCFAPRVLYVNVETSPVLSEMQERLEQALSSNLGLCNDRHHSFNPHLTIAHKDLSKTQFTRAWSYFEKLPFERECNIRAIALLKHLGGRWEVYQEIGFGVANGQ